MCDESDETDHTIFKYTEYQNYRWTKLAEYRNQKQKLIKDEHTLKIFNNFDKSVFER